MNTLITNPRQFRLYGVVLAMAALLAVLLAVTFAAGPAQAQVGIGPGQLPRLGDNEDEYSEYGTLPCTEEVEAAASDEAIISDGYYAVFDGFWDYEDGHLSNNFCPPKVTVTTEGDDEDEVTVYKRADANIHISKTAFSIPDSYKVTVIDSRSTTVNGNPGNVTGPTIDIADFPFLAEEEAVSAVKPGPDSTEANPTTVFANETLWWVRLDQPWTSADETSPLQIGFSTDLLEKADWYKDANGDGTPEPPVRFLFDAFHVFKDGRLYTGEEAHRVGAHLFAFDQRATDTPSAAKWSSVDTDVNEVQMFTDQYKQLQFAFTEPGSYLVQVNFKGHVRNTDDPAPTGGHAAGWGQISPDDTITSPVQWYTFHVGPQADVGVALEAGDVTTTDDGKTVPITVTATNSGPDAAENVRVEINLPQGLGYVADATETDVTYNSCGVITWNIGTMAAPTPPATPTETPPKTTLRKTFTLNVDAGAAGKRTVTAQIHTDTFDPDLTNNTASVEVMLGGAHARPPFFMGVTRSIVEHAIAGTYVGEPVTAKNPDGRALNYWLTGRCHGLFDVHDNTGQIYFVGGENVALDYEEQWEYSLKLHVSDGVNANVGTDTTADHWIPVTINVLDTPDDAVHPTVSFGWDYVIAQSQDGHGANPTVGRDISLEAEIDGLPEGSGTVEYAWEDSNGNYDHLWNTSGDSAPVTSTASGEVEYKVHVRWNGGGIIARYTINWVN